MSTGSLRNLREALPVNERYSLEAGSEFWDDPKVMFEPKSRTPAPPRIEDIAAVVRALPKQEQPRALEALQETLSREYLYKSIGPGDTPTYVRPKD